MGFNPLFLAREEYSATQGRAWKERKRSAPKMWGWEAILPTISALVGESFYKRNEKNYEENSIHTHYLGF